MPLYLPQADLSLAPTLRSIVKGVPAAEGTVRGGLALLAQAEFRAVQLDATLPGIRPRELSTRARQDLLALLLRSGLHPSGLDVFLPRKHFVEAAHLDRAIAASLAAIELAADLGRIPVSLGLPIKEMGDDAKAALVEAAEGRSVPLAVYAPDATDELWSWLEKLDQPLVGAGLDPADCLARQQRVDQITHRLSRRLLAARLSDVRDAGGLRCPVGEGELDALPYRIALDLAKSRPGPVILDLRGLEDPRAAALTAKTQWDHLAL